MRPIDSALDPSLAGEALGRLVEGLTARLQAGEPLKLAGVLRDHPEHAGPLARMWPALLALADLSSAPNGEGGDAGPAEAALVGTLGDYRIVREVGRGGMGVVYEAEQISLGRRVALKVLPFAATMDPKHLQRFHNEARAAASLQHPNIVQVFAVGCDRAVDFYAMQYIDGQTLADVVAARRGAAAVAVPRDQDTAPAAAAETEPGPRGAADWRLAAGWGVQAAEALEHAHQTGVVHRDVKPANLILDGRGKLYVTDFGLARLGVDAGLTMTGDVLGTLRYMAPEQALAKHGLVDHRADVYSLGATLYELVALRPAVEGEDREEVLRRIAFEEPPRLRAVVAGAPADLETILAKALAREPQDRYATAQELADDLRRFLEDRPILARRQPWPQRVRKWVRRHRAVVRAAAVSLAVALAVGAGLLWREREGTLAALHDAETQRARAEARELLVREHLYAADVIRAYDAWRKAELAQAVELLARHRPSDGQGDLRGFEWFYLWRLAHAERRVAIRVGEAVYHVRFSPDGQHLGSADKVGEVNLIDLRTGKGVAGFHPGGEANWVDFSPDGRLLATAGGAGKVKVWDRNSKAHLHTLAAHSGEAVAAVFSPDGKAIASGGNDGLVKLWDVRTGQALATMVGHSSRVEWLGFTPDGKTLASVSTDGTARLWDVASRRLRHTLKDKGIYYGGALTPDGRTLATAGHPIVLWDVQTGRKRAELPRSASTTLAFLDDQWLASTSAAPGYHRDVEVWSVPRGEVETVFNRHRDRVWCVDFSRDGRLLASASKDQTVELCDWRRSGECVGLGGRAQPIVALAYAPDGRTLAVGHGDGLVRVWDVAARRACGERKCGAPVTALAFDADGRHLAVAVQGAGVQLWDPAGRDAGKALPGPPGGARVLALSPGARVQATAGAGGGLRLWDVATGTPRGAVPGGGAAATAAAVSPDGRLLLVGDEHGPLRWHDLVTGGTRAATQDACPAPLAVAVSPDGRTLATGGRGSQVQLWNAASGQGLFGLQYATNQAITAVAFAPDGRALASAGDLGEDRSQLLLWPANEPDPP
ncbi:MAG: protein kinase [Gemmataceae bacterium]